MKIEIKDNTTIAEIRKNVQARFPFLRLEFFSGGKDSAIPNPLQRILDESKKVESLRPGHESGEINFSGSDTVSSLENTFREQFGLHVQVFRKSGDQWLLTTTTDSLTLDQQNELGKEMSGSVEIPEPYDIHEQE